MKSVPIPLTPFFSIIWVNALFFTKFFRFNILRNSVLASSPKDSISYLFIFLISISVSMSTNRSLFSTSTHIILFSYEQPHPVFDVTGGGVTIGTDMQLLTGKSSHVRDVGQQCPGKSSQQDEDEQSQVQMHQLIL